MAGVASAEARASAVASGATASTRRRGAPLLVVDVPAAATAEPEQGAIQGSSTSSAAAEASAEATESGARHGTATDTEPTTPNTPLFEQSDELSSAASSARALLDRLGGFLDGIDVHLNFDVDVDF